MNYESLFTIIKVAGIYSPAKNSSLKTEPSMDRSFKSDLLTIHFYTIFNNLILADFQILTFFLILSFSFFLFGFSFFIFSFLKSFLRSILSQGYTNREVQSPIGPRFCWFWSGTGFSNSVRYWTDRFWSVDPFPELFLLFFLRVLQNWNF